MTSTMIRMATARSVHRRFPLPACLVVVLSLFSFLVLPFQCSSGLVVRTPVTRAHFQKYRTQNLSPDVDVVAKGGWFALEQQATAELGASNFARLKPNVDMDLVDLTALGGWHALELLAADPKGVLRGIIVQQQQQQDTANTTASTSAAARLNAVVALLSAMGKGYDADLVDGEWKLVLQRQGRGSPGIQKLVGKMETMGKTDNVFDVRKLLFHGTAWIFGGWARVCSTVRYRPVAAGFDVLLRDGKNNNPPSIVLRRIACDIVRAFVKIWKLPGIPLPFLKRKGGYLDFKYLDRDLRVTAGNRGGLFVHARPDYVRNELSSI